MTTTILFNYHFYGKSKIARKNKADDETNRQQINAKIEEIINRLQKVYN